MCCWKEKFPSIKPSTHWPCRFLMPHQELSLIPNSPSSSVCLSNRKSAFPLHLLLSSLFHEYWGVSGGCPGAGHPVRGLLTVPRLSAGAYWREIHINTCLLCLQPLDTAMLPAWHSQALHGPPVETRRRWGFNASMALECGPPVSPPVALTDLSRQCTVWKGTLPSPVAVFNSISCLFGSHLACRDYFL